MAHLSDAVQTSGQDLGALWGMGGALDRQQWQWEAPSRREPSPATGGTSHLPAWLSEYQAVPGDDVSEISIPEVSIVADREGLLTSIENDLRTFRESLKASSTNQVQDLCDSFNQRFKQDAVLGLISERVLSESLQGVSEAIREATVEKLLAASRCLSFYKATWEGIMACKVLRPVDLGSDFLERFLLRLGELPSTPAVQALAVDIICAVSQDQIARMQDGISTVLKAWISSWNNLGIDHGHVGIEATTPDHLHHTMLNTQLLEKSMARFAKLSGQLRTSKAYRILHASTSQLIRAFSDFKGSIRTLRNLRYSWLSVVANMPSVDETVLWDIGSRISSSPFSSENSGHHNKRISHLSLHEVCNLSLDFWTSHGQIKGAESVRATYMSSLQKSGRSDIAWHLIQALRQCNERWWKNAQFLFRFLQRVGKQQAVYHVFRNMIAENLIPASFIGREIYEMSRIDPRCALSMYRLYDRFEHDKTRLLPEWFPDLVIAMIRSPDFAPAEVWNILRVPLSSPYRTNVSCKPLHPARVRLVRRMAVEFAAADCRTPRLALRNVMRCMLYLRRHGVPVSPELTRALTEAGITRSLLHERWIGRRKAEWILDIVRRVEGSEVSATMDGTLQMWLARRITEQQRVQREANPLRVGPID